MMARTRFGATVLLAAAIAAISGEWRETKAAFVYTEDWSGITGTPVNADGGNFSQMGAGTYLANPNLASLGWSMTNPSQVLGWDTTATEIKGVLLNEGNHTSLHAGISTTISGLGVGQAYTLTFNYWGDNQPSTLYSFSYTIEGITNSVLDQSWNSPADLGTYDQISFQFTSLGAATTLNFTESSATAASPIIGSIVISQVVPEPTSLCLGMIGIFFGIAANHLRGFKKLPVRSMPRRIP